MNKVVRARLKEVAEVRRSLFWGKGRNRPLVSDYEEVGLLGEWEFACFSGIMPKMSKGKGGDGGYDFEVPCVFTVDVKTSRRSDVLLVEAGKVKADIYVLAHYMGVGEDGEEDMEGGQWEGSGCRLVGWTSAHVVRGHEPYDTGRGIVNHCIPASDLRPMEELERMMGRFSARGKK